MSALEITRLPDPQVIARATRRRFTLADKLRILRAADACTQHGQLGALLRREGIYSSTLASFRKQQEQGSLVAKNDPLRAKRRKEQEAQRQRDRRKIEALETENQKLKALVELQKKVADLMHLTLATSGSEDENR
jgi:hypothetical protein